VGLAMKKIWIVVFTVLCLSSLTFSAEFHSSINSDKYHYPSCVWAQRMKPSNVIVFTSSDQAIKAGYTPRDVRKPPLPHKTDNLNMLLVGALLGEIRNSMLR
jgi:hypothetical protein